jgi:hypothetical protein
VSLSEKIRKQIENDLENKRPINQIKKAYGVGSKTVYKIRDNAGISRECGEHSQTKNANAARREYCAEKRIALIDAGMKRLEEMLPTIDKPSGMRDWFIALATAIDKRRLESPPEPPKGESDGFLEALDAKTPEVWKDAEADTVQMDPIQPETMANTHVVDIE